MPQLSRPAFAFAILHTFLIHIGSRTIKSALTIFHPPQANPIYELSGATKILNPT